MSRNATATAAQSEASRINGRLSLGPISTHGRMVAARNATRHGMTGLGKCLPLDMELEMVPEVAMFSRAYQPRDDYEGELIRRAALGNLRARRLYAATNAVADERKRNASRAWDEARDAEVAALAGRLDAEPAEAVRLLSRLAEGCDYLGDAWEALGQALAVAGCWDEAQALRALHLLGIAEPPSPEGEDNLALFWRCVLALRPDRDPEGQSLPDLPDPVEAHEALLQFVRERAAEMESLGRTIWDHYDKPSRLSAATRAAFDAGPEAARLQRYIKDAERMRDRAIAELHRLRREERLGRIPAPSPSRNEPEPPTARLPRPERLDPQPSPAQNEPEPIAERPAPSSQLDLDSLLASLGLPAFDDLDPEPSGVATVPVAIAPPNRRRGRRGR